MANSPTRVVGHLAELWRYPVKSMGGESLAALPLTPKGLAGDRLLAIKSTDAPIGKPLLRFAQRASMLRVAAALQGDGSTFLRLHPTTDGSLQGETPDEPQTSPKLSTTDPRLGDRLTAALALPAATDLTLLESDKPFVDVRPVALHSLQAIAALAKELGRPVDSLRFRSNLIVDLCPGITDSALLGTSILIGDQAKLQILEPIPRCRFITLAPVTAEPDPDLLRHIHRHHAGRFGLYARPVVSGDLRVGDPIYRIEE